MKIKSNTISIWCKRGKEEKTRRGDTYNATSLACTVCSTLQIPVRVKRNNCMFLSPAPKASWRRSNHSATVWNTIGIQAGGENSPWFPLSQFEEALYAFTLLQIPPPPPPPPQPLSNMSIRLSLSFLCHRMEWKLVFSPPTASNNGAGRNLPS